MISTTRKPTQADEALLKLKTPLRVLVVDDTALYRKIVKHSLEDFPNVEVVGTAHNGLDALEKIRKLKPDMITLDLEMPELDGIGVLKQLQEDGSATKVVVVSSTTRESVDTTISALNLGAFDFFVKPSGSDVQANIAHIQKALKNDLYAFAEVMQTQKPVQRKSTPKKTQKKSTVRKPKTTQAPGSKVQTSEIVVIGISTGGPDALMELIPQLPGDLQVPVLIVQHMPALFTASLAKRLNELSTISVKEARHFQSIRPGEVLIAPGGRQMKIGRAGKENIIKITDDPPEQHCRPSVDYLFRSVAKVYREKALGVIMTGMGHDGTESCRVLHEYGAPLIAQDESSCVVYGMPRLLIEEGLVKKGTPLEYIDEEIIRHVGYEAKALV